MRGVVLAAGHRRRRIKGRLLGRVVAAATAIIAGSAAARIAGSTEPNWPHPSAAYRFNTNSITLTLAFRSTTARTLVLRQGQAEATTTVSDRLMTFRLPHRGVVEVEIQPPTGIVRARSSALRPSLLSWNTTAIRAVRPPHVSIEGSPAQASVNEADLLGVRIFGVPVRDRPRITAVQVAMVHHGDRLSSTCWTEGDTLTTDLPARPQNLPIYTSDIWFKVRVGSKAAFIPDVRYSRTGHTSRLNLPRCAMP